MFGSADISDDHCGIDELTRGLVNEGLGNIGGGPGFRNRGAQGVSAFYLDKLTSKKFFDISVRVNRIIKNETPRDTVDFIMIKCSMEVGFFAAGDY
jgi:hypothetical protein